MIINRSKPTAGRQTLQKPVLVTGAPRSGTTWMGKMLALSGQLNYFHEPFNPDHPLDGCITRIKFPHYMMYISEELDGYRKKYYQPFKNLMEEHCSPTQGLSSSRSLEDLRHVFRQHKELSNARKQGKRPLIKDPIAIMSAGWLARTFDMHVIVMIRHPAAVVASMQRLNWSFDPKKWALSQPLLLRDYLSPFESEMKDILVSNADIIDRVALLWKIIYFVVARYQEKYPDWIYVRHEDIARDPVSHFEALYQRLGLNFSDQVKVEIDEFTSAKNPSHSEGRKKDIKLSSRNNIGHWKHVLSTEDVGRIRKRVDEVARFFYSDPDWELDNHQSAA